MSRPRITLEDLLSAPQHQKNFLGTVLAYAIECRATEVKFDFPSGSVTVICGVEGSQFEVTPPPPHLMVPATYELLSRFFPLHTGFPCVLPLFRRDNEGCPVAVSLSECDHDGFHVFLYGTNDDNAAYYAACMWRDKCPKDADDPRD